MTAPAVIAAALPRSSSSTVRRDAAQVGLVGFLSSVAQRAPPSGHNPCVSREERFRAAFEEHYRAVARFVRTRGHGSADADDIIAATFDVGSKGMDKGPN